MNRLKVSVGLRLRFGVAADLSVMYELDRLCFEAPFQFSRASMRRFTQAHGAFSVVADTSDGAVVGFIVIQMGESHGTREGYVVTLDVAEDFRRQGVAGTLLAAAEEEVLGRGGVALGLHVWTENRGAIRFYERSGYEQTQLHPEFYDAGRDAYGYRKEWRLAG